MSARYYLERAIAPSTRRTYEAAFESYRRHCRSIEAQEYDLLPGRIADWMVSLAAGGQLNSSTIETYLSGLSTWYEERTAGAAHAPPNPANVFWVRRIMKGIKADRALIEQQAKEARLSPPLLLPTVKRMERHFDLSDEYHLSVYAAAALAVGAVLRPNALLGSQQYPERGVRAEHLSFFAEDGSPMLRGSAQIPHHLELRIPVDKNDQTRKGQLRVVGSEIAVPPVWRLWNRRPPTGHLFRQRRGAPMRPLTLMKKVRAALVKCGYMEAHRFTPKCFRRGGAGTLSDAGASGDQISGAGGWSLNASTYQSYLGPLQQRSKALAASRLMDSLQ